MKDPRELLRPVRLVVLATSVLGLLYLIWRFDTVRLPAGACSPIWTVRPGTLLVVDRSPDAVQLGDVVFFRDELDELRIARVGRDLGEDEDETGTEFADVPPGWFWLEVDPTGCPSPSSAEAGPIEAERVMGRLVVALPW